MNLVYTLQQLEALKRPQLWEICSQLALPNYRASRTCIEAIMSKQPIKVDEQTVAQAELEIYIDEQALLVETSEEEQIESLLEAVEVDEIPDRDFGGLCRLWHNTKLLGTFYRRLFTDEWIARPSDSIDPYHCSNEDDAKYSLVAHHLKAFPASNKVRLIGAAASSIAITLITVMPYFPAYGSSTQCDFRGNGRRELNCPDAIATTPPNPKPKPTPKLKKPAKQEVFVPRNNGSPSNSRASGTR